MTYVINEKTKKQCLKFTLHKIIVYKDDNYVEFGYVKDVKGLPIIQYEHQKYYMLTKDNIKLEFAKNFGEFIVNNNTPNCLYDLNVYGNGRFPYTIDREYGAACHIDMFNGSIKDVPIVEYEFSKHLKYSFGLEFETAAGYVPEDDCFALGLIPLRDGSITGVEYSTIPMNGNEGINRLKAQLECLKKNTIFNKECSTHIHFGGFPINKKSIWALYTLWTEKYQYLLEPCIPPYSYNTAAFKANGKNYCNTTPSFNNFEDMYKFYVGKSYLGDLHQAHPNDVYKKAKWNIKTRYFNCNFINMLCYKGPKTIEFRFLTPTYSFEKLTTFILIFNALLLEAEQLANENLSDFDIYRRAGCYGLRNLENVVSVQYPKEISNYINNNISKLKWLRATQYNAGDYCGSRVDIEYKYFPDGQ